MKIELRQIDDQNKDECFSLKVSMDQAQYVAPNEKSLEEAMEDEEIARPFAIYADGRMVGFTMFAFAGDEEVHKFWLWRFMIDHSLQGKGYGKAAMKEIISYFRAHGADSITLSTKATNESAISLYRSFGFVENGEMNDEETVFIVNLTS